MATVPPRGRSRCVGRWHQRDETGQGEGGMNVTEEEETRWFSLMVEEAIAIYRHSLSVSLRAAGGGGGPGPRASRLPVWSLGQNLPNPFLPGPFHPGHPLFRYVPFRAPRSTCF